MNELFCPNSTGCKIEFGGSGRAGSKRGPRGLTVASGSFGRQGWKEENDCILEATNFGQLEGVMHSSMHLLQLQLCPSASCFHFPPYQ